MMESTNCTELTVSSLHVKLAFRLTRSLRKNTLSLQGIKSQGGRARTVWGKCPLRSCINWFTVAWGSIYLTVSCLLLTLWRWYRPKLTLENWPTSKSHFLILNSSMQKAYITTAKQKCIEKNSLCLWCSHKCRCQSLPPIHSLEHSPK